MPKAPTRLNPAKARAAIRSEIAAAQRYKEICEAGDLPKVEAKIECLWRAYRGLQG
jgi:hypothetical protein